MTMKMMLRPGGFNFISDFTPWYNCCTARRSSMSERIAPGNLQSVECAGLRYRNGGVAIVTRLRIVWRLLAEFTQLPLQSLCIQ